MRAVQYLGPAYARKLFTTTGCVTPSACGVGNGPVHANGEGALGHQGLGRGCRVTANAAGLSLWVMERSETRRRWWWHRPSVF